jgi:chromosomal replication initiator protein
MTSNPSKVWENCLSSIKTRVSNQSFQTWFEPIVPLSIQNNTLTIQVPSKFFYEWLEDKYVDVLREAINTHLGAKSNLEYTIFVDKPSLKNTIKLAQAPIAKGQYADKVKEPAFNKSPFELDALQDTQRESHLNPAYSFTQYVGGECNSLGLSAGVAISDKPGTTAFNPLMVYGGVGLGKTHLLQAIGNAVKEKHPSKFVLYVSSEKFTNQFVNAIKNNTLQGFSSFYMNVDVLIVDDVQFLAGKEKTQETFFHIFNHLHQTGKQIIMSSDRAPKRLEGFMDRLLSRFKWGLTAELQRPDFETKVAIIKKKLANDKQEFPAEVIDFLANNVQSNIRELEGVLISLMAQASLNKKLVDIELAKKTLKSLIKRQEKVLTMEQITETVAEYYKLSIDELRGKSRKKELIEARQVSMYLIKDLMITPLTQIGYFFGRDHSAIIYSVKAITENLCTDTRLQDKLASLKRQLQ